ncbi:MAG: bifunctional folylpolyglutamate synthase/dihydrofolate synthase [Gemmatimonadota bacterium]|nr:bifunctional folylpolyglutamate synthase/dihydrofolate synthase [Gemmatimonadota bacterium]MDQ8148680.1 bifunctional folylpolyglutamate synthase/dihydrofolate synthase [Gemmatimonadota bacterium]
MGDLLSGANYRAALEALFARTTGQWRLGLDRVESLLAVLGDPHRRVPVLHVAGTNGKGSVCAALEHVLRRRGWRVAKYTSPHLVDFRERFLIDGRPVPETAIVDFLDRWTPTVERIGATFFEATTAMGFQLFADAGVDLVVIETGLGGRLDATNVVDPLVAGVTGIGLDHTEFLGTTRAQIAPEKAGIFKPGRPAVVGEPDAEIRAILAAEAVRRGASPIRVVAEEGAAEEIELTAAGTRFRWCRAAGDLEVVMGLPGRHQASNALVALTMLDALPAPFHVPPEAAVSLLADLRLAGRFSRHGSWIFDVAHNPDGAVVSAATLQAVAPPAPVVALVSVLGDKDWRGILDALAPVVDRFILTNAPTAPASRAWDAEVARRYAMDAGWVAELIPDFETALAIAPSRGATVLVTGSFHTVGDAMARLQVNPATG